MKGKVSKATKKFVKTRLKDVITQRKKRQRSNRWRKEKTSEVTASVDNQNSDDLDDENDSGDSEEDDVGFDVAGLGPDGDDDLDGDSESDEDAIDLADMENEFEEEDEEISNDDDDAHMQSEPQVGSEKRAHLKKEILSHKQELEEVLKKDPVFYEFLKENDPDLLKFGDESDVDVGSEESDAEDASEPGDEIEDDENSTLELVTPQIFSEWRRQLKTVKSLKAARKVVLALRTVIAGGESQPNEDEVLVYRLESKSSTETHLLIV
ncbi:hypothetical protein HDU96_009274 [Phlyctochytrium bullatum]|nr:hypothetical protein HDU96_009274 [Phlyctochytrium bullatum]